MLTSPIYGIIPPLLIVSAFILPLISIFIKSKKFYDLYALLINIVVLMLSIIILIDVYKAENPIIYPFGGWPPPIGIVYEIDRLNGFLGFVAVFVMFMVVLYSWWYTGEMDEKSIAYYYTLLLGLEAGVTGCIYTGDAFNLFVMLEVLSISAYGLVAFYRNKPQAVEASIKYSMVGIIATALYFFAVILLYGAYGTLNMADLALKSRAQSLGLSMFMDWFTLSGGFYGDIVATTAVALAIAFWAFMVKSALFPNHFWLLDAHPEAPAPVSAILSGVVVNVGIYAVIRFVYTIFGQESVLGGLRNAFGIVFIVLGGLGAVITALLMAVQKDVKRLLAYSTVQHVCLIYMALGTGIVYPEASGVVLAATMLHILNHSIGKSMLFMSTGVLIRIANSRDIDRLIGSGRIAPIAGLATVIGALHLLGLPPLAGFFSKLYMYNAYLSVNQPILAILLVLATAISVMGYAKLLIMGVAKPLRKIEVDVKSLPTISASLVLTIMTVSCIVISILLLSIPYIPISNLWDKLMVVAKDATNFNSYISSFINAWQSILGVK
ncbi:NADH/Ubiquinone/plastoquinone (complex I) [Ignisphaera aggregans DSM 17230]|uniref:NADH/Ubiquinone/plastoquinone (Complex I) n=1 Tax=Ignisphaera aggregans (strain DSM 17230 / JCM 13409 / AQ1.S1) TaxID=583356 RepID=E0ST36_IGNAA|nr:NADH/Ubiquinone/plastoquinone (complex I) [Ignisphaera aggregans DSM 17230]